MDFYWTGKMKSIKGQCRLSRKRYADDPGEWSGWWCRRLHWDREIQEGFIYQGQLHDIYYREWALRLTSWNGLSDMPIDRIKVWRGGDEFWFYVEAFNHFWNIIEIGDRPVVGSIIRLQACFLDEWSNLSKSEFGWKLTISKWKISKTSNNYRKDCLTRF